MLGKTVGNAFLFPPFSILMSARSVTISPAYLILLFLGVTVLLSAGNWALPLIDRDEPRFAEASREMKQTGDFIIPHLNGADRFDKPPLIYWLQASAFSLLGESDFAARLPSVLFAAATSVVTALFGARLYGARIGLTGGIFFGTCLQVFIHGRAAVADMPMVFFFAVATWLGWEQTQKPFSKRLWLGFYSALALGFLAKGPIAFLPLLFPAVSALLSRTAYRARPWKTAAGLFFALLVIGIWGVSALLITQGAYFNIGIGKHVVMRSLEPMESHGLPGVTGYLVALPFYFVSVFFSFLPWSFLLPAAIRTAAVEDGRQNPAIAHSAGRAAVGPKKEMYLLSGIALVILTFTLLQTKLPHYILPCFPLLAIVAARQAGVSRWVTPAIIVTVIFYLALALVGFPRAAPLFVSKSIVQAVQPDLTPKTRIGSVGYDEPSLIWYFRFFTSRLHEPVSDVEAFLNRPGPAVCVVDAQHDPHLSFPLKRSSGYNIARWHLQSGRILTLPVVWPHPQRIDLIAYFKK